MSTPIRVLIVDDHALFRGGVRALLSRQPGFEVVGEASDALEGVKRAKALGPDVVLLDLHMPGVSGVEAIKLLAGEAPSVRVLMLTVSEDADDLVDTLRAGASGYLIKNIENDALLDAVRRTAAGDVVVSAQMTRKLVQGLKSTPKAQIAAAPSEKDKLSPREREILISLARGASNKEIARDFNLAESTVKVHVQHILRKLDLVSRVQAAVYAVEAGLIENGKAR